MFDDFDDIEENGFGGDFSAAESAEPEGLDDPAHSTLMVGHNMVEQTLLNLINSGAMPHALIFSGPVGIGKSTMAFRLTRYLLKHGTTDPNQDSLFGDAQTTATNFNIPADDTVYSQVASGGHPDLLSLGRLIDAKKGTAKKNFDVDTARKVAPFLRMTASYGGWRVVIVDDADSMNRNAQNALLKILEEPPANALLILITHRLGAMIPTIRSRCRVINFDPLDDTAMATLLDKQIGQTIPQDQKDLLNALSGGSIGQTQGIIDSNGLETVEKILHIFENWPNLSDLDIYHLSDQTGRAGQDNAFIAFEKTMLWLIESFIFALANSSNALSTPLQKDCFGTMMRSKTVENWLEIYEELKEHLAQASYANLDKRQAVLLAFNFLKNK